MVYHLDITTGTMKLKYVFSTVEEFQQLTQNLVPVVQEALRDEKTKEAKDVMLSKERKILQELQIKTL